MNSPKYIFDAKEKPSLPWHDVPLIRATEETVRDYGCLVADPAGFEIEIERGLLKAGGSTKERAMKAAGSKVSFQAIGRATFFTALMKRFSGN